ncbi:hypothetical protein MSG28_014878 [Choristoneura fumiferana]|uniref:Uncharacterized protein n=1 Tax=Choristoneura fumiferana TaxID=7141 RepID=A0ACC0KXE6_CHOFU|nr:hypothetical protein MSG28_014878 [Choristoneura fumiferana]
MAGGDHFLSDDPLPRLPPSNNNNKRNRRLQYGAVHPPSSPLIRNSWTARGPLVVNAPTARGPPVDNEWTPKVEAVLVGCRVKLYQFMAKDNVPFHAIMFPTAVLAANRGHVLVDHIFATEYLNYEEGKFSKSRGVGVFGTDAQDTGIPSDVWRFYLASVRPESSDSSFSWVELGTRNNSELLNNLGNFCHRSLSFCANSFKGRVPEVRPLAADFELMALVNREVVAYVQHMEKGRLREALKHVLLISKLGNQHMQSSQPWVLLKGTDDDKERGATAIALCCQLVALLCALIAPYMPAAARRLRAQLNVTPEALRINPQNPSLIQYLPAGHGLGKPEPLFSKIEPDVLEKLKAKYAGTQDDREKKLNGDITTAGSNSSVAELEAAVAAQCKYHKGCVAVPDGMAVARDWVCPECKSKPKRADNNSTPGKGASGSPAAAAAPAGAPTPPSGGETEVAALRREMAEYIAEQREFRAEIRASLKSMGERMDEIERRLDAVESREAEVAPRGGDVEQLQQTVERLQLELNDRDQDALLADLDIGQLPEEPGENVVHTVTVLAAKLGVTLEPRDVVFAERVGAPTAAAAAGRARRVVVRLTRRQLRDDLLRAARVRRNVSSADVGQAGPPRRVYVNERLTRVNRQLFHRVREECHRCQWRFSWTRRGRIYARQGEGKQAFCLRSDADLERVFGSDSVCSLCTNHDNIAVLCARHNLALLAINETWIRAGEDGRAAVIPGYRFRHSPRPQGERSRGGGVGYYTDCIMKFRTWPHPVDPAHRLVEQMWVTCTLNGKKIVIGTAYRPPWMNSDLFFDALSDSISSIPEYDHIILLGDFNINLLGKMDSKISKLHTFLSTFNLSQLITKPTHFTETSQTLLDVVCTDLTAKDIMVEHVGGSLYGHCLIVCELNIRYERPKPYTITYRALKNITTKNFDLSLQREDWSLCGNVNVMVSSLNHRMVTLFDHFAPVKSVVIRHKSYPWITDTVKLMMELRDKALSQYHRTKSDSKKQYYRSLKSIVNRALYTEKIAYFKKEINSKIHVPKTLWNNLKSTLLPKSDTELPSNFNDPNVINNHFLKLPCTRDITISQLTYFEFFRFSNNNFKMETVSIDKVTQIIKSLKTNAEGYDGINLNMIIMTLPYTLDIITKIINKSITTSIVPDVWKIASVRPLPKTKNPTDLKELRPVSILPCFSKVLEKVVCMQLTNYLERNEILPEFQSGFRKGRSTVTALLDITDNIICAQDEGMCTFLVLLDFSRAFDSLNISLLLSKLSYYGFDSNSLRWFDSYLSNRFQYVNVTRSDGSSQISDNVEVKRGVPQGSILGPILFILYLADIKTQITNARYHIYADDIQIYISCKPTEADAAVRKLNEDLARIATWASNNSLLLNPTKTKYIVIGSKQQLSALRYTVDVKVLDKSIERVYEARNLGLLIDSELRYEKHIANTVQNCFYKIKVLYKARAFLSEKLRIQLVESLVLSKLNYMDVVYGPRLLAKTKKLIQRVQNACSRFCFNIPLRAHVTPFLNKHIMLKMHHRRKLHLACLLFDVLKHRAPMYLVNKLTLSSCLRSSGERKRATQLLMPRHKTAAFRGSFRPRGKRSVGRPRTRWTDDLVKAAGSRWMQAASNRSNWRSMGEAYVQQWTACGWHDDNGW